MARITPVTYDWDTHHGQLEELVGVMRALEKNYPEKPLVVLAHSRGGLLVRRFLKSFPKNAESIVKVITLHSPHTGSNLANIATTVRQLIDDLQAAIGNLAMDALGWLYEIAKADAFKELVIDG